VLDVVVVGALSEVDDADVGSAVVDLATEAGVVEAAAATARFGAFAEFDLPAEHAVNVASATAASPTAIFLTCTGTP
jgi:hypothetical protein